MPPPPPPPPGPPKPPPMMKAPKASGAPDRNALLSSIQKGAKLKKVTTNDRSSPLISGKTSTPTNNPTRSNSNSSPMMNGGGPQLAGLFAGGMPKLRPTGKGRLGPINGTTGNKSSTAPALPPARKPAPLSSKPAVVQRQESSSPPEKLSPNVNGYMPPSPKPSMKSNPAPPPPPTSRKPAHLQDRSKENNSIVESSNTRPAPPKPPAVNGVSSGDRNPPLPAKPAGLLRSTPSTRGAPPRPPSDTKPNISQKIANLNGEVRRPSIDRSKSMREPSIHSQSSNLRVGTSAESPAAPYRTLAASNRPAPPIPTVGPTASKTVGRVAGSALLSNLRPPSQRPPKPPNRPSIIAPPPPSQPPPPPPPHKTNSTSSHVPSNAREIIHCGPPLPPERVESTRSSNRLSGTGFEIKFSHKFKSRHHFPLPEDFSSINKSYPSKNNGMNQRRAPQPPTSTNHPNPPPPPPHAPLHIQVGSKLYGTEASQC